jgi:hypothetical protein
MLRDKIIKILHIDRLEKRIAYMDKVLVKEGKKPFYKDFMKSQIKKEYRQVDQILALFNSNLKEEREKGMKELYEAYDAKYKDFELTRALGEILREKLTNTLEVKEKGGI